MEERTGRHMLKAGSAHGAGGMRRERKIEINEEELEFLIPLMRSIVLYVEDTKSAAQALKFLKKLHNVTSDEEGEREENGDI